VKFQPNLDESASQMKSKKTDIGAIVMRKQKSKRYNEVIGTK
jgi:hypothetical protein